jgi:hypothetical protein
MPAIRGQMIAPETDRVLITGAAGAIGRAARGPARPLAPSRLTDIRPVPDLAANEELVVADHRRPRRSKP